MPIDGTRTTQTSSIASLRGFSFPFGHVTFILGAIGCPLKTLVQEHGAVLLLLLTTIGINNMIIITVIYKLRKPMFLGIHPSLIPCTFIFLSPR